MKAFLSIVILAITLSATLADNACKGQKLGKRISHPTDCGKFIVCIGGGVEMDCPAPTHFNAKLEVCDWPERAGCASVAEDETEDDDDEETKNSPFTASCKGQKLGQLVNHPTDCGKYIVCIGGGVEMSCPAPTHFNAKLQTCDWPERAGCASKAEDEAEDDDDEETKNSPFTASCKGQKLGQLVNHPTDCGKYIVCIGGGVEMSCPAPTHFNAKLQTCDWPERAGCASKAEDEAEDDDDEETKNSPFTASCKGQTFGKRVSHPSNCAKFIVCIGGGVEMDCPAPTHFNAKLEVCDWPERAGCE